MSDSYQAIFDAVRSRISGGDIGSVAESALREAFSNADHVIRCAMQEIAGEYTAPSVLYRPRLSVDGSQWCALYGEDLQSGVAGFGNSPGEAMSDFNKNWCARLPAKQPEPA